MWNEVRGSVMPEKIDRTSSSAYVYIRKDITEEEIDGETIYTYKEKKVLKSEIDAIKKKLFDTDYAIIKIAEGVSTKEEYADIIRQRQIWRDEINQLESADD